MTDIQLSANFKNLIQSIALSDKFSPERVRAQLTAAKLFSIDLSLSL